MARLTSTVAALFLLATRASADPIIYTDNFEAATFNPFWTFNTGSGSVSLSSGQVQGGSQAVRFDSVSSGLGKDIHLIHNFSAPVYGRASVWVYDTGADVSSSNYLQLAVSNSQLNQSRNILAYDYDLGLGQNGSVYYLNTPADFVTAIDRTRAWHEFVIDTTPTSTRFQIDGQLVLSQPAGFAFDRLQFGMFGPSFRPAWTGYFDTFAFREFQLQAVPEPASLAVVGVGLLGLLGAKFRRRVTAPLAPVLPAVG